MWNRNYKSTHISRSGITIGYYISDTDTEDIR